MVLKNLPDVFTISRVLSQMETDGVDNMRLLYCEWSRAIQKVRHDMLRFLDVLQNAA